MKLLKLSSMGAFFCSLFLLPSLIIEDASLGAEEAIRGRTLYTTYSYTGYNRSRNRGFVVTATQSDISYSGFPGYRYGRGRSRASSTGNVLAVRSLSGTLTSQIVNLDDLSLNQALPDPPDVNLNISQSSDSKKALVRWNID